MNIRHSYGVLHSFSNKNTFNNKMELRFIFMRRLFYAFCLQLLHQSNPMPYHCVIIRNSYLSNRQTTFKNSETNKKCSLICLRV